MSNVYRDDSEEYVAPAVPHAMSAFRQGNWEHPDHTGRIVGWFIPNDVVERMGADAFCLPREVEECLTKLIAARRAAPYV